jgi:type I restriction enzyme, R subunit
MRLTEDEIELYTIQLLQQLGYTYMHGRTIAPDGPAPERSSFTEVLLKGRLMQALRRIQPEVAPDLLATAAKELDRIASPDLLTNNETFHTYLTEGIPIVKRTGTEERGDRVWLIDFDHPERNEFLAVNQFTVVENSVNKRPDILLFVNGIPLVIIELKNATDSNATLQAAYKQVETYKDKLKRLFTFHGITIISDGLEAKAGSLSAGLTRFANWKTSDGKQEASALVGQLETLVKGMLQPAVVLDLIRYFTVFEKSKREDPKSGITSITTVKKLAAYHQYYAVNKAVESTLRASGLVQEMPLSMAAESPQALGLPSNAPQKMGDRKAGVVWHTQGSGKSLSMVFYTGKLVLTMQNPTILVITDRNDLDDQLFDTFAASRQLLRQEPVQAESRAHLKELLKVASGGVVFATIQKFQPEDGTNIYELLSDRKNIVVIADEAHRTQYGFSAKVVDAKDLKGNVIGKKVVYGFAKYMRDALPNATYLGFTGTPIESTDVNTAAVFGNYVDIYDIAQAVEDGATVRIYYESRLAKVQLSAEGKQLVKELDDDLDQMELTDTQKAKAKWAQLESLIGSERRIRNVARDIVEHFEARQKVFEGKAMVVSMSRRIAAELYAEIVALRPDWHSEDLNTGAIKVVMTAASSDGPEIARHHTTKDQRRKLADRMKDPHDPLRLVIVRDMWLTGFDAPSLHTLYIDKPMQGHNLMQAIARVNRVYQDKPGGLIVDYLGIASDLKKALSFYGDSGGKGNPAEVQEEAVLIMTEKLEVVTQMFYGFDYSVYFTSDVGVKLNTILAGADHILGLENGRLRFMNEVAALSQAFALSIPHEAAMAVNDQVAFFQAINTRFQKIGGPGGGGGVTDVELETTIKQVIDQALVSDEVVDVYDAAGIKKPDISVLSEEFLAELRGMPHKNLAFEVLKRLIADEITSREALYLTKSKTFMEMLEQSIQKYHNKIITAAEVIEELISLGKAITNSDSEAKAMGLTDFEYAFYTAVAENESARELMQKDKLRELAVVLTETIRKNATIDWTIKESVRAKLRVEVRRVLKRFGYPPDMQLLATETVIRQAEMVAGLV